MCIYNLQVTLTVYPVRAHVRLDYMRTNLSNTKVILTQSPISDMTSSKQTDLIG